VCIRGLGQIKRFTFISCIRFIDAFMTLAARGVGVLPLISVNLAWFLLIVFHWLVSSRVYCTVEEHSSPRYAKERIVHIGMMQNDNAVELASISNKTENYVFYTWQQTPSFQILQVILKMPLL